MKAAVVREPFVVEVVDVPDPEPRPGHVIVAVEATSICGSDVNGYKGVNPRNRLPTIPGHEIAGTVASAADADGEAWIGRRVVVEPNVSCRQCKWCRLGLPNVCDTYRVLGESMDVPGGLAEFVSVAADQVFDLPEHVTAAEGAVIQPLSIAYHGVVDRAQVQPRETVLVLGAGPIGLAGLLLAQHAGARVLITDVNEQRLEFARRLGADAVYRADQVDVGDVVRDATGGFGADVTLEAVGGAQDQTILDAVAATSTRGRIVVLGTFAKGPQSIPAYVFKNREQTLMGSHGHPGTFEPTIDLVARKEIRPLDLITQRLHLTEIERAFAMLDSQADGVVKIVIEQ
jgi:threonine dehydrogenase-like Zn-dependent dehydrogenase